MKPAHLAVLAALVLAAPARGGEAGLARQIDELRKGRGAAKPRVIAAGAPAVGPLFALLAEAEPRVAWEARSALRWIAVRAAERTAPAGQRDAVVAAILPFADAKRPPPARRTAIELLGLAGTDRQVGLLAAQLGDEALADAAALALSRIWGQAAKGALLEAVKPAKPPLKVRLLELLASHREANTLPVFVQAAKEADATVRAAALRAIGLLGVPEGLPTLLEAIRTGSPKAKAAAFDALLDVADARLRAGDGPAARALYEQALGLAGDDGQKVAALAGIGRVGRPESLGKLEPHLAAKSPRIRAAAHTALCQIQGPDGTRAIAAALPAAPLGLKPLLIRALGERGDRAYTALFVEAAGGPDEAAALAAVGALERLGDPALAATLLELAKAAPSKSVRAVALAAAVRLAHTLADRGQGAKALPILTMALPLAGSDAQRSEVLRALGKSAQPKARGLLLPVARDPENPLRDVAVDALVGLADALVATGRDEAILTYKHTVDLEPPDALVRELTDKLRALGVTYSLAVKKGFITSWWLIGPFPCRDFRDARKPRFPETEIELAKAYKVKGKELRWKLHHSGHPKGWIDLNPLFNPNDKVLTYAYTEITSAAELDVKLWFRRDDGLTVWLNGKTLYDEHSVHSMATAEFSADARLQKGINRLLVKSSEGSADWQFAVRLTDRAGKPFGAPH